MATSCWGSRLWLLLLFLAGVATAGRSGGGGGGGGSGCGSRGAATARSSTVGRGVSGKSVLPTIADPTSGSRDGRGRKRRRGGLLGMGAAAFLGGREARQLPGRVMENIVGSDSGSDSSSSSVNSCPVLQFRGGSTAHPEDEDEEEEEEEEEVDDEEEEPSSSSSKAKAAAAAAAAAKTKSDWLLGQLNMRQQRLGLLSQSLREAGFGFETISASKGPAKKEKRGWDCKLAAEDDEDEDDFDDSDDEGALSSPVAVEPTPCLIMGEVMPGFKAVAPKVSKNMEWHKKEVAVFIAPCHSPTRLAHPHFPL